MNFDIYLGSYLFKRAQNVICNALSKDLEVLPANYEIRISFKWELYNIAG